MSFEIKDLSGLSKPLCKLIDSVNSAVGTLYTPHKIVRNAKAKAKEIEILAHAEVNKLDIYQRTQKRIEETNIKEQKNIESIISKSSEYLLNFRRWINIVTC